MPFQIAPEERYKVTADLRQASGLNVTYLTLLILSTFIASFGLLSNSTATVIGAMLVAPLMGPILGLALSLVEGDLPGFRKALLAETVGIVICLVTAIVLASALGPAHIDLSQSEIVGRTHPTLFDLAVGFAAGLAGAYATTNRKISGSIAGVAIAVALVPPLCVSGLSLGCGDREGGLGAFVLFLANFLTIQLAASLVFALAGLGDWQKLRQEHRLIQAFCLNLVLLIATGYFLTRQLVNLVRERKAEQETRRICQAELSRLSGANLDSLQVRLKDQLLAVELQARAPEDISVTTAQAIQQALQRQLNYQIELRIGTARASYVTPNGRLFAPSAPEPGPAELLAEATQKALGAGLKEFPGVELTGVRQLEAGEHGQKLLVMLRSPYVFDARLVSRFQTASLEALQASRPEQQELQLTVRTSIVQDYTEAGLQEEAPELPVTAEQQLRAELEQQCLRILSLPGEPRPQIHLTSITEDSIDIEAVMIRPRPLPPGRMKAWQVRLQKALGRNVSLQVDLRFGQTLRSQPLARGPQISPGNATSP